MSDYLWDRTGHDPEIARLERLLAPTALAARRAGPSRKIAWFAGLAAAALFAVGAIDAMTRRPEPDRGSWTAREDGRRVLDLGRYGEVVAESDAKVRVVRLDEELHSLRLDRGTIHASITTAARPRLFQVETPAATCIDLGCHYSLTVDANGVTEVRVDTGRVLFDHGRREVFVPQGASCKAAPGRPPFTPIHETSSPALKSAVEAFDAAPEGKRTGLAKKACALILKREDGLVAWHFLQDPEKGVVAAANEALVRLTRFGECGIDRPPQETENQLKAWRNRLFPEWSTWD